MSKKASLPETKEKAPVYPSQYGSHKSMIDNDLTTKLLEQSKDESLVVLRDQNGLYVTKKSFLDNNLSDVNRYNGRPHHILKTIGCSYNEDIKQYV